MPEKRGSHSGRGGRKVVVMHRKVHAHPIAPGYLLLRIGSQQEEPARASSGRSASTLKVLNIASLALAVMQGRERPSHWCSPRVSGDGNSLAHKKSVSRPNPPAPRRPVIRPHSPGWWHDGKPRKARGGKVAAGEGEYSLLSMLNLTV